MGKPKYWLLGRSYPSAKAPREETLSLQCPKNPVPVIRCGREASIAQGLGHFLPSEDKRPGTSTKKSVSVHTGCCEKIL